MHIVGRHKPALVALAELDQLAVEGRQLGDVVRLQFDEEVIRAEDLVIPVEFAAGFFRVLLQEGAGYLGRHAPGGADQAFGMGGEKFVVDAGVVIETFQLGSGRDLEQVLVSGHVLGQQQQVG